MQQDVRVPGVPPGGLGAGQSTLAKKSKAGRAKRKSVGEQGAHDSLRHRSKGSRSRLSAPPLVTQGRKRPSSEVAIGWGSRRSSVDGRIQDHLVSEWDSSEQVAAASASSGRAPSQTAITSRISVLADLDTSPRQGAGHEPSRTDSAEYGMRFPQRRILAGCSASPCAADTPAPAAPLPLKCVPRAAPRTAGSAASDSTARMIGDRHTRALPERRPPVLPSEETASWNIFPARPSVSSPERHARPLSSPVGGVIRAEPPASRTCLISTRPAPAPGAREPRPRASSATPVLEASGAAAIARSPRAIDGRARAPSPLRAEPRDYTRPAPSAAGGARDPVAAAHAGGRDPRSREAQRQRAFAAGAGWSLWLRDQGAALGGGAIEAAPLPRVDALLPPLEPTAAHGAAAAAAGGPAGPARNAARAARLAGDAGDRVGAREGYERTDTSRRRPGDQHAGVGGASAPRGRGRGRGRGTGAAPLARGALTWVEGQGLMDAEAADARTDAGGAPPAGARGALSREEAFEAWLFGRSDAPSPEAAPRGAAARRGRGAGAHAPDAAPGDSPPRCLRNELRSSAAAGRFGRLGYASAAEIRRAGMILPLAAPADEAEPAPPAQRPAQGSAPGDVGASKRSRAGSAGAAGVGSVGGSECEAADPARADYGAAGTRAAAGARPASTRARSERPARALSASAAARAQLVREHSLEGLGLEGLVGHRPLGAVHAAGGARAREGDAGKRAADPAPRAGAASRPWPGATSGAAAAAPLLAPSPAGARPPPDPAPLEAMGGRLKARTGTRGGSISYERAEVQHCRGPSAVTERPPASPALPSRAAAAEAPALEPFEVVEERCGRQYSIWARKSVMGGRVDAAERAWLQQMGMLPPGGGAEPAYPLIRQKQQQRGRAGALPAQPRTVRARAEPDADKDNADKENAGPPRRKGGVPAHAPPVPCDAAGDVSGWATGDQAVSPMTPPSCRSRKIPPERGHHSPPEGAPARGARRCAGGAGGARRSRSRASAGAGVAETAGGGLAPRG